MVFMNLTIGKALGISRCALQEGVFSILAFDHRNNLRKAINPANPENVSYQTAVEIKSSVVRSLAKDSSAMLLDPEYGINKNVLSSLISSHAGLILSVEKSGYEGSATDRKSSLIEGWSVEKAKRSGANAVKLLVYFHPLSNSAEKQIAIVDLVSSQCVQNDLPLFLEILTYSIDPQNKKLSSEEKLLTITKAVDTFSQMPVDLYKLEFPCDVHQPFSNAEWEDSCHELSSKVRVPWLLLSAGVDFDMFVRQTEIACRSGASGVMAGRAIWKEAIELQGIERDRFLSETAPKRMQTLAEICKHSAKPWTDYFQIPSFEENWYHQY